MSPLKNVTGNCPDQLHTYEADHSQARAPNSDESGDGESKYHSLPKVWMPRSQAMTTVCVRRTRTAVNRKLFSLCETALSKVLSTVKAAGYNPVLLKPDPNGRTSDELQTLSDVDIAEVHASLSQHDPNTIVPIVMTSAVKGSGIRKLQ